eukprot:15353796-Ditylum_brightwellii.AAC.1
MPKKWAKFKACIKEWLEICHQASKSNEEPVFNCKDLISGGGGPGTYSLYLPNDGTILERHSSHPQVVEKQSR